MSIELSPKHGVNATIPVCFWCGKERNEIALMGRVRERDPRTGKAVRGSDVEMPMRAVLDYEPCDCCKEQFSQGVHIIECSLDRVDGRPAMTKDNKGHSMYPTGRFIVMKSEAAKNIFNVDPSMLEPGKKMCMDTQTFSQLMGMVEQPTDNN